VGFIPGRVWPGVQAEILEARTITEGRCEHFSQLGRADQEKQRSKNEEARDLKIAKAVQCKIRYFRDGAELG
jgi:hypothetical protein